MPAHDAFTRLLARQPPDTEALWQEARTLVQPQRGLLIGDDTTLDKPYARKIEPVTRHWSGTHHRVVQGINLVTLAWTDGTARVPCDFRLYDKPRDGKTKNDLFREMLTAAHTRGLQPAYVLCDSGYSSLDNLKHLRALGFAWLTRFKSHRKVNPDGQGHVALRDLDIPWAGRRVHLRGHGSGALRARVFRTVSPDGDATCWATSDTDLSPARRQKLAHHAWAIEDCHRGLKQCCGVEKAQVRSTRAQTAHIGFAIRAFLRLECYRLRTGQSWYETQTSIVRAAVCQYLANPFCTMASTA